VTLLRIISAEKARFPVSVMCEVLEVNRASFYAWETRPPSDRALSDAWLIEQIREIWEANRTVYGARRIHAELRLGRGVHVSRKRVERLMREAGISGLIRRRRKGNDDPRARRPGRRRPRPARLSAGGGQRVVVRRHHLPGDLARPLLPGRRPGPLLARDRRLAAR
jgi:transposase InsO family protein